MRSMLDFFNWCRSRPVESLAWSCILIAVFACGVMAWVEQAQARPVSNTGSTATTEEGAPSEQQPGGDLAEGGQAAEVVGKIADSNSESGGNRSTARMLVVSLTIFVLAVFVGFEVITKVPPTLHTPLMSGSNAISGITIVGAMAAAGHTSPTWAAWFGCILGLLAMVLASVNVVGGFLVTHRMLMMFKKK